MDNHIKELLSALETMNENDIEIECQDGKIHAPGYMLKARSPVFRAMLNNKMKESQTGKICLKTFTARSVELMIKYVKTAKFDAADLPVSVLFDLLQLAEMYAFKELHAVILTRIKQLATQLAEAIAILHYSTIKELTDLAMNTIHNCITNRSPAGRKVRLSEIDPEIKTQIIEAVLAKSALVDLE